MSLIADWRVGRAARRLIQHNGWFAASLVRPYIDIRTGPLAVPELEADLRVALVDALNAHGGLAGCPEEKP